MTNYKKNIKTILLIYNKILHVIICKIEKSNYQFKDIYEENKEILNRLLVK